ncbi:MAG: hypothetical protein GC136_10825 [Alphaproteobacteria bacterium]|nr:hypothetical protein [Alphaproteobacteria bacterium]
MKHLFLFLSLLLLAACETAPESDPSYISPTHYQNYNCNQISAEMQRVSTKLEQATSVDSTNQMLGAAVAIFAISKGRGISGGGENVELKRLRNQYDVLEQTAIQKECHL